MISDHVSLVIIYGSLRYHIFKGMINLVKIKILFKFIYNVLKYILFKSFIIFLSRLSSIFIVMVETI